VSDVLDQIDFTDIVRNFGPSLRLVGVKWSHHCLKCIIHQWIGSIIRVWLTCVCISSF